VRVTEGAATASPRTGVLLVNLGTPRAPTPAAVRRYLREFLMDPRVLDIPWPARWLLVHAAILPTRPRRSAEAYAKIWTREGSPLLVHGRALAAALGQALGPGFVVELAMRYGEPRVGDALDRLRETNVARLLLVPLYPQWAESSSGSSAAHAAAEHARRRGLPPLEILPEFFDLPGFAQAWHAVAAPVLADFRPDHVLFSYHGLPERQIRRADPTGQWCFASPACCDVLTDANRRCYRAQCFATTRSLAPALGLDAARASTSFQSRLGRTPWIRPFTDERLPELRRAGAKRLAVLCPAFVADCLETLEEIGLRARDQWLALGGEDLRLVPSLNAHPVFVEALAGWVRARAPRRTG
jgi:ferrochelatase